MRSQVWSQSWDRCPNDTRKTYLFRTNRFRTSSSNPPLEGSNGIVIILNIKGSKGQRHRKVDQGFALDPQPGCAFAASPRSAARLCIWLLRICFYICRLRRPPKGKKVIIQKAKLSWRGGSPRRRRDRPGRTRSDSLSGSPWR